MELLGITSIRPGANGRDLQAPNGANYDESKVKPIEKLPDPLTLKNGKKVTKEKFGGTKDVRRSRKISIARSMDVYLQMFRRSIGRS